MTKQDRCPECGKPLPETGAHRVCPACLMAQAMASRTIQSGPDDKQLPAPPSPEEIADRFPQFEVVECLGRGGMGVVYKARQKSLDRWVAIKVLHPGQGGGERFAARFESEARTLAKMSHPNIVTVFDHGEAEGLYYIVMEFVDGVNLRDLLRDGKMEPEQALAIVPPVCEALEYAHDKGVVHRDIKPENLLLDREGRVKIADFGIASLVGAEGERSGTPPYMAPEQAQGVVDRRADIYALGAVLYEMLTGERPAQDLVAPSKRVEVDVKIDEMVLRALEEEPERRYQTAEEFRTVVQTIATPAAAGRAEVSPVVDTPAASAPPGGGRRKLLRVVSLAGVLAVMTAMAGVSFFVKIVPGWEDAWCRANMSLSTGQQLLLSVAHFCQRIWFLLVPLLLLALVAVVASCLVGVRGQRAMAGVGRLSRRAKIGRAAAACGGIGLTIWALLFVAGKLSERDRSGGDLAQKDGANDVPAERAAAAGTDAIEGTLDWRSVAPGLQFRIAPGARELGSEERKAYSEALATGRWEGRRAGGNPAGEQHYRWLPFSGELSNASELVTDKHNGETMLLVSEKPAEKMVPGKGRDAWQVEQVGVQANQGGPENFSVSYELDDHGAVLFAALTGANIDRPLAIIIDGVVVSAPIIRTSLGKRGIIVGRFSKQEATRLMHALASGGVTVAPGPESGPAREEVASEEQPGARPPPSGPLAGVMEGLQPLDLTEEQAAKIREWLRHRGATVGPAALAEFVKSILRDDQQAAFKKIIESGGRPPDAGSGGGTGGASGPIPPGRGAHKKPTVVALGLIEPVEVITAGIIPDGGTLVVELNDAAGRKFVACIDGRMDRDASDIPGLLHIGVRHPSKPGGRKVAYAGPEEAALHGVLLRWAERQPDWEKVSAMTIHEGHKANRLLWELGRFIRALDARLAEARQQGSDKEGNRPE